MVMQITVLNTYICIIFIHTAKIQLFKLWDCVAFAFYFSILRIMTLLFCFWLLLFSSIQMFTNKRLEKTIKQPRCPPHPKNETQLTKQKKVLIEGEQFCFYFFPQQPPLWFWTWKNFHHVPAGHSVQSAGSSSRPRPFPPSAVSLGWSASWQP